MEVYLLQGRVRREEIFMAEVGRGKVLFAFFFLGYFSFFKGEVKFLFIECQSWRWRFCCLGFSFYSWFFMILGSYFFGYLLYQKCEWVVGKLVFEFILGERLFYFEFLQFFKFISGLGKRGLKLVRVGVGSLVKVES